MALQGKVLQDELLRQLEEGKLSPSEKARIRCRLSKEFEDAGNYEAAHGIFGDLWKKVGVRPKVDDLDERTRAEVLLRAGAVTGFIGQAKGIEGAQERAKDLISESLTTFELFRETELVAEALTELAVCYWREGSYDNARTTVKMALERLHDSESDIKAIALLRLANIENSLSHFTEALRILKEAEPLFMTRTSHALRGKYHMNLAMLLKNVSRTEKNLKYQDEALLEFAAASFHLKEAGHTRYWARSENNLGFMLFTIGNFTEAHEHLDQAYHLFTSLREVSNAGQVDETRALAFLAEGRPAEAATAARRAVLAQEESDEQGLRASALTTYGISLARSGRGAEARSALERAVEIYELLGEREAAALGKLTMIEELSGAAAAEERAPLTYHQRLILYRQATSMIGESREPEILSRLRRSADILLEPENSEPTPCRLPEFIYADEKMGRLVEESKRLARSSRPILITGEAGTGKAVLAREIHLWSKRQGRLIEIDCAHLSDELLEKYLLEHCREGLREANLSTARTVTPSDGGTLLLRRLDELSLKSQAHILRLLENQEAISLGSQESVGEGVRVIATTSRNLRDVVRAGAFLEGLYTRVNTFHLHLPPLSERRRDIHALATFFIQDLNVRFSKCVEFTDEALTELTLLPLTGNVRELKFLLERAVESAGEDAVITDQEIKTATLRARESVSFSDAWAGCDLDQEVTKFEGELISLALKTSGGGVTRAAQLLGISHQNLVMKLEGKYSFLADERKPPRLRRKSIIAEKYFVKGRSSRNAKV